MANEVVKTNQKKELTFSAFMTNNAIVNKVNSIIGDEKSGKRFISGIISAVSVNPQLSECENALFLGLVHYFQQLLFLHNLIFLLKEGRFYL